MSSKGALGATIQKNRSQNVNSVFSGKNTAVSKALGPNKHGGLQALGKTTTIVRRMPKPATLPSLKAEHGQDSQVCLVPQGGQGWLKSTEQQNIDSKTGSNLSEINSASGGGPDLRPNWAKQSQPTLNTLATANATNSSTNLSSNSGADINAQQAQANSAQSGTVDSRDYPSLAVSMKYSGGVEQKLLKTAQEEEIVPLPNVMQPLPAGYIGASGPRVADRKLPERYYCGSEISRRKNGQKYNFLQKISKLSLEIKEQQQSSVSSTPQTSVTTVTTDKNNITTTKNTEEKSSLADSVVDFPITKLSEKEIQDVSTQDSVLQKHINQSHIAQSSQKIQSFGETSQLQQTGSNYSNTENIQCISSELKTDLGTSGTYKKRICNSILTNQQKYGNEQSGHLKQKYQPQHQDAQTGALQSSRGDIGYDTGNQSSEIQQQHHQHPPLRNFERRTSISRDILELQSNGNASIYDYSTPPPNQHSTHYPLLSRNQYDEQSPPILSYESSSSISGNYRRDEVNAQHYRNLSYNNNRSGVIDEKLNQHWEDINKTSNEFTQQKFQAHTRQPLLLSQPSQSQQIRYCIDSRHTSESESGWYVPLNNLQQQSQTTTQGGRRSNSSYSQNGSNSGNGGWYSNGSNTNNSVSHYPPSLLSLETSVMDNCENSNANNNRFVSKNRYGNHYHHSNDGSRISVPRNGPVTSSYITDERFVNRDDLQTNQQNSKMQKTKNNTRRVLGTELSYTSENDSHATGTYLNNDFFDDTNDIMLDKLPSRQKNLWERTSNNTANYNQRDHFRDQQQFKSSEKTGENQIAPQFRMLKRNDEKSAEYFANYSTGNILSSENNGDNINSGRDGFDTHNNYNNNHQYNSNKKILNQKNNAKLEDSSLSNQFNLDYSHQISHNNDTQQQQQQQHGQNFQQKDYSKKTQNQNFGSGTAVLSAQQQHKFNRAPGGGKVLQLNYQPQILGNTSGANKAAGNNNFLEKTANNTGAQFSGSTNTIKPALLTTPTSSANFWEKRKEERQSLESKTQQQAKQNRQFDYHFPTMSDAVKHEPNLSNEINNLQHGLLNDIKNVRINQNYYNDRKHGQNHWDSLESSNIESHWDEFAPTTSLNGKNNDHRRNERQNQSDLHSKINSNTGDNLMPLKNSTYDGVREFVNSKNRVPLSVKSINRNSNIKMHLSRGNNDNQRVNSTRNNNNERKNYNRSDNKKIQKNALNLNSTDKHYDNVIKEHKSNDSQRNRRNKGDNFSNMGEFHAEDYKILAESVEQNKKRDGKMRSNENKDLKSRKGNKFLGNESFDKRSNKIGNGVYVGRSWRGNLASATASPDLNTEKLNELNVTENKTKTNEKNNLVENSNEKKNKKIVNEKREFQHQRRNRSRRVQGRNNQNSQIQNNGSCFVQRPLSDRSALTKTKDKIVHNEIKNGRNLGDCVTQIKSPVISDGGAEEWETASESSDFVVGRAEDHQTAQNFHSKAPDREKKANLPTNGSTQTNLNRRSNEFSEQKITQQKNSGQKNVKPASHTYQGNVVSVKNKNKNNESMKSNNWKNNNNKNARESRKELSKNSFSSKNGLAGVDINDASVVVIDYHPDHFTSESHSENGGDFEEVLSRKSKRQRIQKQEEERRKLEREKEKQERIFAKRIKQQQKRNERTTSRKNNYKKEKKESSKITVFTNQNFASQTENNNTTNNSLQSSIPSSKSSTSQNNTIKTNKLSTNNSTNLLDSFVSSSLSNSNLFVDSGNSISNAGLDKIAMPTVWNNTLSTTNSSSSVLTTLVMICESNLSNTIIPSPIARPVPKNSNSKSTNIKTDNNCNLDKKFDDAIIKSGNENYEFKFDPSLKEALSVNNLNKIDVSNCYDSLHESSLSQHSLNSSVGVNSDHAQLQKKLDKVKDFWPGVDLKANVSTKQTNNLTLNNIGSNSDINNEKIKPSSNNIKQQEISINSLIISTTTTAALSAFSSKSSGTFVSTQSYSFPNNSNNSKGINNLSNIDFDINRSSGINFVEINNTNRCVSANLTTQQSPVASAVFGNSLFALGNVSNGQSSQVSGLPPYSIMLPNGDFVTHLSSHHSVSSPPVQHIMSQPRTRLIGSQRPSRPNTFIDQQHALIMTHNQLPVSNTPWSTNGGFEFLNGIGATPPPLSASASVNMGRSSVPLHNSGFHSATLTQHFVAPLSLPSSLPIYAQPTQTFNSNSTITGNARNSNGILSVSGAHLQHPPPHLFTSSTTILQPPPINKLGTGPSQGAIVSMPPTHFQPPIQLGSSFMPSPSNRAALSSSLDWANVQSIINNNNVTGSQVHNSSLQGINQMPSMMHPPPSFLPSQNSDVRNRPQMVKIGLYFKNL